jgi:DNA excision repair protein ERCC-6-like 2
MQTNPGRSHATNAEPATNATPADDGKQEDEEGREAQEAEPSPPLPSPRDEESKQKEKDEIWQSDDEDPVAPEKTNPRKKATAKKRAPSAKERAPAAKRAPASKSRGKSSDGMAKANHGDPVSSDDDDEDPAAAQLKLYPMLKKPVFGPYELEPLILEKNSDRPYQVPSSINRYLSDYQQEGIQFMFDKCAETKGAILGDDMGLGKTIQVIGLFAALLEKTGTKLDQIELKRRKKLVNKRVHEIRLAQEQALRAGSIFTPPDVPSEIGLPDWCPILVVVPKAVVKQWMEHLKNWGYFAAERFSNGKECELERARNGETEIVVCGVPQFSNADYADLLATVKWRLVVIDEFHKFKNEKTNGATNLRALRSKVEDLVVIGLTGTLMQNEHRELWNLIDLAQPGLLGTWSKFMIRVAQPITQGEYVHSPRPFTVAVILVWPRSHFIPRCRKKDAAHDVKERGERVSALFKAETLPKVFLRRTKEEKLREFLPAKDEIVVFCELSKTQKEIYSYILKQPDFVLLSHANGPCDCSANDKVFREYKLMKTKAQRVDFMRRNKDRITRRCECHYRCPWDKSSPDGIAANAVLWRQVGDHGQPPCCCKSCPWCIGLPALSILYRLVSHVSLLQVDENPAILPRGSQDHIAATKELEKAKAFLPPKLVAEGKIPGGYFRAPALDQGEFCEMSGKLSVLKKLLKRIDNQHGRVLIFSAYTTVLDVIEAFLQVDLGCVYRRMDGKTSEKNRDKYKQEFKSNPNILAFLLSTKAMGLGLDLTEANNVIIFDVEWNPSWDAQAQE